MTAPVPTGRHLLGLDIYLDHTLPDGAVLMSTGRAVMHPDQAARMGLTARHAVRVPWWRRLWRRLTGQQP